MHAPSWGGVYRSEYYVSLLHIQIVSLLIVAVVVLALVLQCFALDRTLRLRHLTRGIIMHPESHQNALVWVVLSIYSSQFLLNRYRF